MAGVSFSITTETVVATTTTEKTILQLRAAVNHRVKIKEWGISFAGTSNTATPVEVELRRTSADGTLTAATEQKIDESDDETVQATGFFNASVEPTTKTAVVHGESVHPQTGYTWQSPFGGEIEVIGGNAIAIIVTAAADVNVWAHMICEE